MSYEQKLEVGELNEILSQLEEQGWEPMLCDTPVDVYENPVNCGLPQDVGDVTKTIEWYPHELMPPNRIFMVPAKGDSMRDAGIEAGDMLTIETDTRIMDDDMVLAHLDGDFTVKAYYEGEDGTKWLVPFNEKYEPIRLSVESEVSIVGKVIEVTRRYPRVSHSEAHRIVRGTKEHQQVNMQLTKEEITDIIRTVAPSVEIGRQWFSVYCPLAHRKQIEKGNYAYFCSLVAETVPAHKKLPVALELQRLDVLSFSRPVAMWDESNAPVRGKRFRQYKVIADKTIALLNS
jgi:hypothetical protein